MSVGNIWIIFKRRIKREGDKKSSIWPFRVFSAAYCPPLLTRIIFHPGSDDISNALLNVLLFISQQKKKLKASHAWLLCKVRMLLTNSLLFLPPFASLRLRHRRVASKEQKKIVLWICRTIMLNPRCETNKFSLFFRFCRCGHNAKGNGSPWCPISRKKSLHKKLFSFSFFLVGWITSAFCNIIREACAQIYTMGILSFLLLCVRSFAFSEYIHERIIFLAASCSTLTYSFAFGDFLMRVERNGGKNFARQMDIFQITATGWNSRFVAGSNLIFLFCAKRCRCGGGEAPMRNLRATQNCHCENKLNRDPAGWDGLIFFAISRRRRLHFVILTHAETVALTFSFSSLFMNH